MILKNTQGNIIVNTERDNKEFRAPQIGDIYLTRFDGSGSEQTGWRPGVIFQNNIGNIYSPNVVVLPLTSQIKKDLQPTHVILPAKTTGLRLDSMVLCENPKCISKEKLGRYILTLSDEYVSKIAAANILASSAIAFLNPDDLLSLRNRAALLNNMGDTTDV